MIRIILTKFLLDQPQIQLWKFLASLNVVNEFSCETIYSMKFYCEMHVNFFQECIYVAFKSLSVRLCRIILNYIHNFFKKQKKIIISGLQVGLKDYLNEYVRDVIIKRGFLIEISLFKIVNIFEP